MIITYIYRVFFFIALILINRFKFIICKKKRITIIFDVYRTSFKVFEMAICNSYCITTIIFSFKN
ncbi:hypothetical protein DMS68_09995 [Klebsiella variicola]|nr:hypothetical protein DMS68_09995 [Klebsiella variicola]